jgi:hypothetical protein
MYLVSSRPESIRRRIGRYFVRKSWELHRSTQRKRRERLAREAFEAQMRAIAEKRPRNRKAELVLNLYLTAFTAFILYGVFVNVFGMSSFGSVQPKVAAPVLP